MAHLWNLNYWYPLPEDALFRNIPNNHRSKIIIQSCRDRARDVTTWEAAQMPDGADWAKSYILGHGEHKCFLWYDSRRHCFDLEPYLKRPDNERPNAEHPITEIPAFELHTTFEHIAMESPTPEISTPIHPTTGKPHHIFTRIKFWKAPTFRRLVQQIRLHIPVRPT
ncbi:hypothetical protein P691DRAFT_809327 [Macrolepiota fuliginosa MF-IS2]|uniref:Uncharacterized protein n=1 Tax=Macrolepiota fuliginosa MF-IS2 TaxID=1400762 RepID=A0A9P5X4R5_9AGAR|nr:hypothetical protein P691DRAFT_809327 [Macrolepiota fuliginosa MF-IS2]